MAKSKSIHAFACVGSHGHVYFTCTSTIPENNGRGEIYSNVKDAERMALSKHYIRKVRIIVGDYVYPQGKTELQK